MTKMMAMAVLMSVVSGVSFAADSADLNDLKAGDVYALTRPVGIPAPAVIENMSAKAAYGSHDEANNYGKDVDTAAKAKRTALANAFYAAKPLTKEEFLAMRQDLYFEAYCLNTAAQMENKYIKSYERGRVFIEGNKLVFGAVRGEDWPSIPSVMNDKNEIVFYGEYGLNTAKLIVIRKTSKDVLIKSFYSTGYEGEREGSDCFGILKN